MLHGPQISRGFAPVQTPSQQDQLQTKAAHITITFLMNILASSGSNWFPCIFNLFDSLVYEKTVPVRSVGGHGIIGICQGNNTGEKRDLLAADAGWIALAS